MKIRFELETEPVAKSRPRLGDNRVYTPSKTRRFENTVAVEYQKQFGNIKFEGPVKLVMFLGYEPPKSLSKKKRQEMIGKLRDKKPDIDNLEKSIMDGLQKGGAFNDDSQVAIAYSIKYYAARYSIRVELEEISAEYDVMGEITRWEND